MMTDDKINRALMLLNDECPHEWKRTNYTYKNGNIGLRWTCECGEWRIGHKTHPNLQPEPEITEYTESLDLTLALAEKLGYLVDIDGATCHKFICVCLAKLIPGAEIRDGSDFFEPVSKPKEKNCQYTRRLALATAILKAENKWEGETNED